MHDDRRRFDYGDLDVDIIMKDGELWIEATAEYGGSEDGWGTTTKTIFLDREKVAEFVKFLAPSVTPALPEPQKAE